MEGGHVIEARDDGGVRAIAHIHNHHPGITPGDVEAILIIVHFVEPDALAGYVQIGLVPGVIGLAHPLPPDLDSADLRGALPLAIVNECWLRSSRLRLRP